MAAADRRAVVTDRPPTPRAAARAYVRRPGGPASRQLADPLLTPRVEEQDGYVPNVVYSCGALVHADTLVVPYGISDAAVGVASVPMPDLLAALDRSRNG